MKSINFQNHLITSTPNAMEKVFTEFKPSTEGQKLRKEFVEKHTNKKIELLDGPNTVNTPETFKGNIENYIGITQVPTGIVGPLKVNGQHANGEFFIPLATTEGALVASYHRGTQAITRSGGVHCVVSKTRIGRAPGFRFNTTSEAQEFAMFALNANGAIDQILAEKSRFAKLVNIEPNIIGNILILLFEYTTGDAAGQNMVTICTDAICKYLIHASKIKPKKFYIESNLAGDKKPTAKNVTSARGRRVIAEATITKEVVKSILKSTPEDIVDYYELANIASIHAGAMGAQGHYANGLAALFLATGNDVACVSESFTGINLFQVTDNGDLYVSVNIPNFVAGTVGGGTSCPTQSESLDIMNCKGSGNADKFAEIAAGLILAGELSISAAISAGHFTNAHQSFGRK